MIKGVSLGILSLILMSCGSASQLREVEIKPVERFQTFRFQSGINEVREAIHKTLDALEYTIEAEDPIQLVALKSDVTSVELITYSQERLKPTQSVFSGEIQLTLDYLDAPEGGTFLNVKAKIKGLIGRSAMLKNPDWQGQMVNFTSRGDLENEILERVARFLGEKRSLQVLISRGVELEGGFTLQ